MESLGRRLAVLGAGVEGETERLMRKGALVLDSALVLSTPVDTGRARANWIVSLGKPSESIPQPQVTKENEISEGEATQLSLSQASSEVARFRLPMRSIFAQNNVEYIGPLDAGSSAQAPRGMVRGAVAVLVAFLRKAGFKVNRTSGG
jgi:hypothetical protein